MQWSAQGHLLNYYQNVQRENCKYIEKCVYRKLTWPYEKAAESRKPN